MTVAILLGFILLTTATAAAVMLHEKRPVGVFDGAAAFVTNHRCPRRNSVASQRLRFQPNVESSPCAAAAVNAARASCLLSMSCSPLDENNMLLHAERPPMPSSLSRRSLLSLPMFIPLATTTTTTTTLSPSPAHAKSSLLTLQQDTPLDRLLYTILRVREATVQETRLIQSGTFKDVQRANVKLAVRFMLKNYKLSDTLLAASMRLSDPQQRLESSNLANRIVETLYTILEYFDASNVENLKVGSYDNMSGKEELVLKGLESARRGMDEFVSYFDANVVQRVVQEVNDENELNVKEFDPQLGKVFNLK